MAEFPKDIPNMKELGFLDEKLLREVRELNLQEESTQINPNGVDAQESRSTVSASCSAIDEANTKTNSSSPSSSRNGEEEDRGEEESQESSSSLVTRPSHQNPTPNQIARSNQAMNPHQQLARTNGRSRSSTSHRNNFRKPFGMQRQYSPNPNAAPWRPQATYQQYPGVNNIPNGAPMQQTQMILPGPASVDHNYGPWRPQNTYQQHPMANQIPNLVPLEQPPMFVRGPAFADHNHAPWRPQNTYQQHPVANQLPNLTLMQRTHMILPGPAFVDQNYAPLSIQNIYQKLANLVPAQTMMPMRPAIIIPWHVREQLSNYWAMRPVKPMMYQNQHPVGMPQFRSDQTMISPSGQPRSSAVSRNNFNPQQNFVLPDLNHQQMLQSEPQMQQPTAVSRV